MRINLFFLLLFVSLNLFSCLVTLANISTTTLSKSSESGYLYLISDFRGNASSGCLLINYKVAIVLSNIALNLFRLVLSLSFFWYFVMEGFGIGWSFSAFVVIIVSSYFAYMVDYIYYLDGLNDPCILII